MWSKQIWIPKHLKLHFKQLRHAILKNLYMYLITTNAKKNIAS